MHIPAHKNTANPPAQIVNRPEDPRELERRRHEDFEFFLVAHAVGDPAIYELFRDRSLDKTK